MKAIFQHKDPNRKNTKIPLPKGDASGSTPQEHANSMAKNLWTPPDAFRLLTALMSHAIWLVLAPVVAILLTILYVQISNPTYEIGTQIMVRFGQELAAPATVSTQTGQQVIPISKRLEDTTAEVQIMKDPLLIRQVAEELGEDFFYASPEPVTWLQKIKHSVSKFVRNTKEGIRNAMVKIGVLPRLSKMDRVILFLQSSLSVEHVTRSDVIEVKLSYPDPDLGEEILRRFIAKYFEKRELIFRNDLIPEFFNEELTPIKAELKSAEDDYSEAQNRLKAWSVDDQRRLRVQRREELSQQLETTLSTLTVAQERLNRIEQALSQLQEFVPSSLSQHSNPIREELELRLIELELQLGFDIRKFGDKSQQVLGLQKKIEELRAYISDQPQLTRNEDVKKTNPLREAFLAQKLDTELLISTSEVHSQTLRSELARLEKELSDIDGAGLLLVRKLREVERLRRKYDRYQKGLDEARITDAISKASISNVVVIAEPKGGIAPVKPRVTRLLAVAVLFSLALASGLILLIDSLRPKIRNNRDLADCVENGVIVRAIAEKGRT